MRFWLRCPSDLWARELSVAYLVLIVFSCVDYHVVLSTLRICSEIALSVQLCNFYFGFRGKSCESRLSETTSEKIDFTLWSAVLKLGKVARCERSFPPHRSSHGAPGVTLFLF